MAQAVAGWVVVAQVEAVQPFWELVLSQFFS